VLFVGNVDNCNATSSIYLNNPDISRCPKSNWLAMTLFFVYILMTSIMLINLLIAIFRLYFFHGHIVIKFNCVRIHSALLLAIVFGISLKMTSFFQII